MNRTNQHKAPYCFSRPITSHYLRTGPEISAVCWPLKKLKNNKSWGRRAYLNQEPQRLTAQQAFLSDQQTRHVEGLLIVGLVPRIDHLEMLTGEEKKKKSNIKHTTLPCSLRSSHEKEMGL